MHLVQRLENLDPEAAQHVSHANAGCECSVWIAEQAPFCSQCRLILAFAGGIHEVMLVGGPNFQSGLAKVYQRLERLTGLGLPLHCSPPLTLGCVVSNIPNWLARL